MWKKIFSTGVKETGKGGGQRKAVEDMAEKTVNRFKYNVDTMLKGKPQNSEGIAFIITSEMREKLHELGYKNADIKRMVPADAQVIIKNEIVANIAKEKTFEDSASPEVIVLGSTAEQNVTVSDTTLYDEETDTFAFEDGYDLLSPLTFRNELGEPEVKSLWSLWFGPPKDPSSPQNEPPPSSQEYIPHEHADFDNLDSFSDSTAVPESNLPSPDSLSSPTYEPQYDCDFSSRPVIIREADNLSFQGTSVTEDDLETNKKY